MKRIAEGIRVCGLLALQSLNSPDTQLHDTARRALNSLGKMIDTVSEMKETQRIDRESDK